jgi:hypothetical protein
MQYDACDTLNDLPFRLPQLFLGSVLYLRYINSTVIPRFTSLIRSSKTACNAKLRKTKINFPSLPDGSNDRFARGRSSYKRKLARKLKNGY